MPMTLNIGLSRKVGEANYGSRGASVNLAVEVEASLLREPDQLREKIKYLFNQAKLAVEEELNGSQQGAGDNGNGRHTSDGNGQHQNRGTGRAATASQVRAIHAIASRQRIDLTNELQSRFGVDRPDDLAIGQASEFIDAIKPASNGSRR